MQETLCVLHKDDDPSRQTAQKTTPGFRICTALLYNMASAVKFSFSLSFGIALMSKLFYLATKIPMKTQLAGRLWDFVVSVMHS